MYVTLKACDKSNFKFYHFMLYKYIFSFSQFKFKLIVVAHNE